MGNARYDTVVIACAAHGITPTSTYLGYLHLPYSHCTVPSSGHVSNVRGWILRGTQKYSVFPVGLRENIRAFNADMAKGGKKKKQGTLREYISKLEETVYSNSKTKTPTKSSTRGSVLKE